MDDYSCIRKTIVTGENDPNRTSVKIKLTPPIDSYTLYSTILLVQTLKLLKAGYNRRPFWEVWEV